MDQLFGKASPINEEDGLDVDKEEVERKDLGCLLKSSQEGAAAF